MAILIPFLNLMLISGMRVNIACAQSLKHSCTKGWRWCAHHVSVIGFATLDHVPVL